ncbi:MAG: hypothetical protein ABSA17_03190 [Rhabdochlamydiaceae bacterium]|jgi:hypothetical protein
MKWKKIILGCLIFVAVERFCYFQTGTFSLNKMLHEGSPPSPASHASSIELQQPLRFIGAGKQFYAFETADGKYVVKFMKWSRRRPLPYLEKLHLDNYLTARARLAANLQKSAALALKCLPGETQLVTPKPSSTFTLIDKLNISHTIPSSSTHYYVQRKASNFTDYFESHISEAEPLLRSFIHTVASQCRRGISNLDPVVSRNYGVVDGNVILLDIGSLLQSSRLHHTAAINQEIVIELLPLRSWLQDKYPQHIKTFDLLLSEELYSARLKKSHLGCVKAPGLRLSERGVVFPRYYPPLRQLNRGSFHVSRNVNFFSRAEY